MSAVFSGVERWLRAHLRKSFPDAVFCKGIPESLFSDQDQFSLVLSASAEESFNSLGALLDRAAILMRLGRIGRVLLLSSYGVYKELGAASFMEDGPLEPRSFVGSRDLMLETAMGHLAHKHAVPLTVLRLFNLYGPFQEPPYLVPSLFSATLRSDYVSIGDTAKTRDFLYVDDFIALICTLLNRPAGTGRSVYNVGTGVPTTIQVLLNLVKKTASSPLPAIFDATKIRMDYDFDYAVADTSKAYDEIGWRASKSLEEGLELTFQWALGRSGS